MSEGAEPSVARILAFMMIDGMSADATNEDKALRLSVIGFENAAIGEILGISSGSVRQTLYSARRKREKGKS